jgi:hypothetical protein
MPPEVISFADEQRDVQRRARLTTALQIVGLV